MLQVSEEVPMLVFSKAIEGRTVEPDKRASELE
jgi:hypothetical protein